MAYALAVERSLRISVPVVSGRIVPSVSRAAPPWHAVEVDADPLLVDRHPARAVCGQAVLIHARLSWPPPGEPGYACAECLGRAGTPG